MTGDPIRMRSSVSGNLQLATVGSVEAGLIFRQPLYANGDPTDAPVTGSVARPSRPIGSLKVQPAWLEDNVTRFGCSEAQSVALTNSAGLSGFKQRVTVAVTSNAGAGRWSSG